MVTDNGNLILDWKFPEQVAIIILAIVCAHIDYLRQVVYCFSTNKLHAIIGDCCIMLSTGFY